jgi:lysyl-tRNA synthetase class I
MNIKTEFDGTHTHLVCPNCNNEHLKKTHVKHDYYDVTIAYRCANGHDIIMDFENYKGRINLKVISG